MKFQPRVYTPLLAASLVLVGTPLTAATTAKFSEEMVVSAHRTPTSVQRIGLSISSLDATDIEARGQVQVADLLRTLPGVAVSNSGGAGKETALRIRGEEGFRTVVYLDGVKLSDPTSPKVSPHFSQLMTSEIERIEVLRGPQGMMYGADAGGIVNIYTKRPTQALQGGFSAETGRYDTLNIAGNVRGKLDSVEYSLTASDFSSEGFNSRSNDAVNPDRDGYDNSTLHGTLGVDVTEQLRVELVLRNVTGTNEYDDSFGGSHDWTSEFEQSLGKVSATYDGGALAHTLSVSRNRIKRQDYQDGAPPSWGGGYLGIIDQGSYLGALEIDRLTALVFGVDVEAQRDELNDSEQDQIGAFVDWQGQLGEHFYYSAGWRHDDNDTFGRHNSYRLTSAYVQLLQGGNYLKYKASYGTGFRSPSLYEQWYNTRSGWAYGIAAATELQEEQSAGLDAGIEFHTSQGHLLEVVAFYTEIDDAIDFDLQSNSGYIQLEGSSRSKGVELNTEWVLAEHLLLFANATYNDTSDAEGEQRVRRPRKVFNLGLQALLLGDRLRLGGDLRGSYDSVDNNGAALDDYEVLSLNATWLVSPELELYVRGENVFAAEYQEVSNYYSSGSSLYGGLRVRF